MPSLWLFISMVALASCQDYHYQRPQTPFVGNTHQQQPQVKKYIVQTLGNTYGLEAQRAPAIYEDHQTKVYRVVEQRQVPQYQQYAHQAARQQVHTTSYQNPLLASSSYQAPTQSLAPPPPVPQYGPPQVQQQQAPHYQPQQQPAAQPPAAYLPPQQPAQKLFFANPFPYSPVTTGSGQQVLDAGHGSGVAPHQVQTQLLQATGSASPQVRVGDQVGQSQSSLLDAFDYKQAVPGDTREYQRFVTYCPGGGNCQKKELGPGEVDDGHRNVLQAARASTQPRVEGCYKNPVVYVPPGAAVNDQGQLRPKSRRTFERQEQVLSRYPYN